MKDLLKLVKHLLKTITKGVGALLFLFLSPLFAAMCATAACLYYCAAVIVFFFASLADDGNLSDFVFPRWSNRSKWTGFKIWLTNKDRQKYEKAKRKDET